ncbi:hypothetical protein JCM5353_003014 [Sporobolomyces roseus]
MARTEELEAERNKYRAENKGVEEEEARQDEEIMQARREFDESNYDVDTEMESADSEDEEEEEWSEDKQEREDRKEEEERRKEQEERANQPPTFAHDPEALDIEGEQTPLTLHLARSPHPDLPNLYAVQKTLRTILSTSRISTLTLRFSEGIANSEWQTRRSERGWSTDPETKEEDEHDSFLYLPPTIPISVRHWRLPYRIESKQKKCFLKAFEQRGPILAPSLKAVTIYTRRSSDKVRREAQGNSEDDEERRRKKRWEYRNTIAPLSSVSQEFARTLPPAPPLPTRPQRQPIPIPKTSPPPPIKPIAVTPTPTRDKPVENDATYPRDQDDERLEQYFLRILSQLPDQTHLNLEQLIQDSKEKAGTILDDTSLNYESTPIPSRRVKTSGTSTTGSDTEQDGIVVVAHVVGGEKTRVNVSTGFVVGDETKEGQGRMIITCSHTLNQIEGHFNRTKSTSSSSSPSATLILTSSGHVYTVSSLLSSLPSSDLLLLRLSPSPISSPPTSPSCPPLRSLPINPYPAPTSSSISAHTYLNPLSRLTRKLRKLPEQAWEEGRIVEYKDSMGGKSETGTYDELSSFWMSCVPTSGSSGGPVVDNESGSVVGVTRGSTHKYGERTSYGFATPAERILDMFALPGFKSQSQKLAEAEEAKSKSAGVNSEFASTEDGKKEERSRREEEGEGGGR